MDKIEVVDNDLVVALRLRFGDGSIVDAGRAAICRALGRAILRLGAAVTHEIGGVRFLVNVRLRSFATRVYPWCSRVDCGARFRQRPNELTRLPLSVVQMKMYQEHGYRVRYIWEDEYKKTTTKKCPTPIESVVREFVE